MSDNGTKDPQQVANQEQLAYIEELVANVTSMRRELIQRLGSQRRNIDAECDYPPSSSITPQDYQEMYDRFSIARRVVQLLPKETWQVTPLVYEDEDNEKTTPFEQAWDELGNNLRGESWFEGEKGNPIWEFLRRVDELSGIGRFGILLLGIDDGLPFNVPVEGVDTWIDPASRKSQDPNAPNSAMTDSRGMPLGTPGVVGAEAQYYSPYTVGSVPVRYGLNAAPVSDGTSASVDSEGEDPTTDDSTTTDGEQEDLPPVEERPQHPVETKRKLLYLRVFPESQVLITQWENRMGNPRFGHPVMYQVTINDPNSQMTGVGLPIATVDVHWTRVIHVVDNRGSSEVAGTPRQQPVWNDLLNLRKIYGAAAEGYWQSAFSSLSLETHPQLGGDVKINRPALQDMMENFRNGLQRDISLMGMTAKTIAPTVSDPTPHIDKGLEAICIVIGCPLRVFKGSERGELASSQDDDNWNDRKKERQDGHNVPNIIVPFIDRLILIGCLPEPKQYFVEIPPVESLSATTKATVALQETQAMAAYVAGGVQELVAPQDFMVNTLHWTEEQAKATIENAAQHMEEKDAEAQALADEHGMLPVPPEGFQMDPTELPPPMKLKEGETLVDPTTGKAPGQGGQPGGKPFPPKKTPFKGPTG